MATLSACVLETLMFAYSDISRLDLVKEETFYNGDLFLCADNHLSRVTVLTCVDRAPKSLRRFRCTYSSSNQHPSKGTPRKARVQEISLHLSASEDAEPTIPCLHKVSGREVPSQIRKKAVELRPRICRCSRQVPDIRENETYSDTAATNSDTTGRASTAVKRTQTTEKYHSRHHCWDDHSILSRRKIQCKGRSTDTANGLGGRNIGCGL